MSATYDLFAILRAMAADPKLTELAFRVGFTVAQAVDARTGWAEISDEKLMVKAAVSLQQVQRGRRQLKAAGWVQTITGKRGQGTRYLFLEGKAHSILKRIEIEILAIDNRRATEAIARKARLAAEAMVVNFDREMTDGERASDARFPIKTDTVSLSRIIPTLPQHSTYKATATVQDVATGHDPETGEIPLPLEEVGGTRVIPTCDQCDQPAVVRCGILGDRFCRKHEWMVTRPEPIELQPAKPIDYRAVSRGE